MFLLLFLQTLCCFCCFVDASPRFCCGFPLCYSTCAVACVTFAPFLRLYLVFLRASVWFFWCSCVFFVAFAVASALWLSSRLVFLCCGVVWLVSWCVGCLVLWFVCGCCCVLCVCLVCVLSLVGVLVCVALSAFWWVLFSVRCFAPPGCLVAGVFCCWCVSPVLFMLLLVVRASVLLVLFGGSWFGCVAPPLFLVRHDLGWLWSCSWFNAECHLVGVAVWCFCSWRLCFWVVVCHPVGSSGSCFVYHVASWSLCCCSCVFSVVSDSSHLLYGVHVSFYCPVFVSVCVYCCVPCFSAWCCSCLLSVAVCSCLLSVHVFCGLCCKCCSGVLPPCLFTVYPFSPVFVPFFVIFR